MLTSHLIRTYAHKVASHFDYLLWLRFFIFVVLSVMFLSEGFSQGLIDFPIDQLISFRDLINSDYSFGEVGTVSVEWSDPCLFESIALKDVDSKASTNIVLSGTSILERSLERRAFNSKALALKRESRQGNKEDRGFYQFNDSEVQPNGTRQIVDVILVNGETVIDFSGGTRESPNILEAKVLVIPTDNDTLIIKNWVEYSDYFLVSRQYAPDEEVLSRIQFKGYGRGAKMRYYDETHWEIVPAPEAVAYGAILGATALGSFVWRKRRRAV